MYQLSSSQPDNPTHLRGYVPPYTPMNSLEFLPSQTPVLSLQNGQLFQSDKQVSTSPLGSASKFLTCDSSQAIAFKIYKDSITLTPTNTYKPHLIPATTSNTSTTGCSSGFDTLSTTESSITMSMVRLYKLMAPPQTVGTLSLLAIVPGFFMTGRHMIRHIIPPIGILSRSLEPVEKMYPSLTFKI